MAVKTPTINKIIRMTEFDLLRTSVSAGNMYMCIDSQKLYYDETNNKRVVYGYNGVKTVNDLLYNITPNMNTTYYCWEDNSLWLWMNKWITLWSDKTYPSAYVYDDSNNINEVYRYDQPLLPADDNGLLKDGSVVIRDRQRIIKGKIYVDDGNDNLVISSYLGGGMRFLPNGQLDTDGEFFLSDFNKNTDDASIENNTKYSFIRSEFRILNNEEYVDYSEHPEYDDNPYQKENHQYKVFHEGNLDASLVKEITPDEIYNKLLDPSLPYVFDFNVKKLQGKVPDDFANKEHTHTSAEITDFNEASKAQSFVQIKQTFNTMQGEGITVSFDSADDQLLMSANNFNLSFGGGVTGTGIVKHLTDTTINMVVDPTKHIHSDYIDTMTNLQEQINELAKIDINQYYKKPEVDEKIEEIRGTTEPTPGKPLLVDENGDLPTNSWTADSLSSEKEINFKR